MQMSIDRARKPHAIAAALAVSVVLCSCSPQTETSAPQPRPVRTVTIEKREAGQPITLTGRIEAEDEVALAFRISGRVLENDRKLGPRVGCHLQGRLRATTTPAPPLVISRVSGAFFAASG